MKLSLHFFFFYSLAFALVNLHANTHSSCYVVIVAGGKGERLWPVSRIKKPKQLISCGDERPLLEQAIERMRPLASSANHVWVLTTNHLAQEVKKHISDENVTLFCEPIGRNTGPAIALCCLAIYQQDPDASIIFVPADAFIPTADYASCAATCAAALEGAKKHDAICLLGVQPTFPATGYGYIEYDTQQHDLEDAIFKVKAFHEKPNLETAQRYISNNNTLWNISIFAGTARRFIKEFEQHAPEILTGLERYRNNQDLYDSVPAISIDYAVIEKSSRIWVAPTNICWYDVGNIATFITLKQQYGNLDNSELLIAIDSHNNLIDVPDKLVALIDVDNLCVIQTDDALLITQKNSVEKVRALITHLKDNNLDHYL